MSKTNFAIFCLTFFTVSFGVAAMAPLVPSIAAYFGKTQGYALRLTWLYMLPYGVCALFWAPLTRVVKVKHLLLLGSFGFFCSALLFSFSKTIQQAFVFRFLMGSFGCSFVPLCLITIAKTVSGRDKAKYIGIFFALSYVSTFVSVFLSGFLLWRIIYLIPAALSVVIFTLILFFLDDFDFRKEKFRISYLDTLRDKQALSFFIVIMLGSFLYHSFQQRFGVYLSEHYFLKQAVISSIFTVATLSAIVFEFSGGFLSARIGNIKVVRIGFMLMAIFAFLLLFVRSYQLFFILIVLWGSGWALTHVGLSAHLAHFPDKTLRDASSLNSALRFSFGGLGAFCGGILVQMAGFKVLFLAVAVCVFILGFCLQRIIQ